MIIRDDGEDVVDQMECVDSLSPSEIQARKEDEEILCKAILGKDLHEVYSGERIKLAVDRQSV